jgi:Holliday junction DNA helicase RuvA
VIGFVDGVLAGRFPGGCLIDVNGVGYRVACSSSTLARLPADGERVRLFTHTYVREDALALIGFVSEAEQRLFEALLGVTGVGVKVALALCSAFTPDAFRRALATDDVGALAAVPGIGKKTAQRVVLELKEKLAVPDLQVVGDGSDALAQARLALEHLGYSPAEVRAALAELEVAPDQRVEDVVKSALRALGGVG